MSSRLCSYATWVKSHCKCKLKLLQVRRQNEKSREVARGRSRTWGSEIHKSCSTTLEINTSSLETNSRSRESRYSCSRSTRSTKLFQSSEASSNSSESSSETWSIICSITSQLYVNNMWNSMRNSKRASYTRELCVNWSNLKLQSRWRWYVVVDVASETSSSILNIKKKLSDHMTYHVSSRDDKNVVYFLTYFFRQFNEQWES